MGVGERKWEIKGQLKQWNFESKGLSEKASMRVRGGEEKAEMREKEKRAREHDCKKV